MNPICIDCGLMMRCKKNGIWVADPRSNPAYDDRTFWKADLFECEKCKRQVAGGFSTAGINIEDHDDLGPDSEVYDFRYQLHPFELIKVSRDRKSEIRARLAELQKELIDIACGETGST